MKDETTAQYCVACGQVMVLDDYWHCVVCNQVRLQSDQTDAERYRCVREFLQRGGGLLDTRGMDDAGFDRTIDAALKECGK